MLNLTVSSLIKNYCMKEFLNKQKVFKYCLKILTSISFVRLVILSLFISISLTFWSQSIEEKTTTGSGSWVCPANVYQVSVECWAGGGGGGSRTGNGYAGGGGGGAYSKSIISVTPSTTYYFSIGSGGSAGNSGGDTWFNASSSGVFSSSDIAPGGVSLGILAKGGGGVSNNTTTGASGGQASSGYYTSLGYNGGNGGTGAAATGTGGGGGGAGSNGNGGNASNIFGGIAGSGFGGGDGADGRTTAGNGDSAFEKFGSGGAGSRRTNTFGNSTGGAGAQGFIRLSYVPVTAFASPSTICTGENSTLNGSTFNSAVTLYSENFERYYNGYSFYLGSLQFIGWKVIGAQNNTYWRIQTSGAIAGSQSLGLYDNYYGTPNSYLWDGDDDYWFGSWAGIPNDLIAFDNSQKINASNYSNLSMSFKWKCVGESGFDYGMICYSMDGVTWTDITSGGDGAGKYFGQSTIQSVSNMNLPLSLNGQQFYIGFRWINDYNVCGDPPFTIDDITITGTPNVGYAWTGGTPSGGSTPNAQTTTVYPTSNTDYNFTLTAGDISSGALALTLEVNSSPSTPGSMTGSTSLCENATNNAYSIAPVSGATSYLWSVPAGATIASGQGTTSVVVDFGSTSGDVSVTATNSCGTSSAATSSVTLNTAPATPGSITGATSLCENATNNTYSIVAVSGATSYTWSVPAGATIASGQGTTSIVVDFGSTSGDVSVTATNLCGASSSSNLNVVIETLPPTNISASAAPDPTCIGSSVTLSGNASGGSIWSWTGPNGFTSSSQNPTIPSVTLADEGTYFLSVSNACGSGALSDNFNDGNYTSNLTWTVQSGDFKSSVNFLQGNNGSTDDRITTASDQAYGSWEFDYIFQTNAGGSSQKIRFFLTAQTTALNSTNGYYIYLDGTDVLRLNKISSGVPTQLISATLPSNTMNGTIKVIRSSDNNFELFFNGVSKGTFTDATYTTSSYIGVWNTGDFVSDNHKIDNIACNPSVSASVNTISNSITAPGSISGATSLCQNATNNTYSIAAVSGATSYTWTVPSDASIVSGQGTTSVVVDFGVTSGDVSVTATNSCGTSAAAIASVTLNSAPAAPGSITGATSLCENATNNTYSIGSVSGATGYIWSVPSGASIASGQGTTSVVVDFGVTSGDVSVTATNSCGTSAAATQAINLILPPNAGTNGAIIICQGTTVSAADLFGALTGTPQSGGTWSPTLAGAGTYTYTVAATAPCATDATSTVTVTEQTAPDAGTNGALTICQGTTVSAAELFGALTGTPQSGGTWLPALAGAGTYTYTLTAAGCTDATASVTVTEQAQPNAGTNGTLDICQGTTVTESDLNSALTVSPELGGLWSPVIGGAGTYTYTVEAISPCVTNATAQVVVTEITAPNAGVSGSLTICQGTTVAASDLYLALTGSPDAGGVWSPTLAGAGTYTYTVTVSGCADATSTVDVTEQALPNAGTSGTLTVCQGTIPTDAELFAALGGTPEVGGTWSSIGQVYTYTVAAVSPCAIDAISTVTLLNGTLGASAGAIVGSSTICANSTGNTYSISSLAGATNYVWSAPSDATIVSGQGTSSVVIDFGSISGEISVIASNTCGATNASTLAVLLNAIPNAVSIINTPINQCAGSTGNVYSISAVAGATSYEWTVSGTGWSLASGQGTTSATVNIGTGTGSVSVVTSNSCGSSSSTSSGAIIPSTVPLAPSNIIQPSSQCAGSSGNVYSIPAVAGATGYNWSVTGAGWSITSGQGTTQVQINIGSLPGSISVTSSNSCGSSSSTSTGTIIPGTSPSAPSPITQPVNQCAGSTGNIYSISAVSGATSYTWSVAGTGWALTAGQGSTSASVTIGSGPGTVSVSASNACGSSLAISTGTIVPSTPPSSPAAITLPINQCAGSTGNIYSISPVSGATSYTWSVSGSGWSITGGQGTTSATVTIGNGIGSVVVVASNICGVSGASSTGAITPNVAPSSPIAINIPITQCSGTSGNVYSISAVSGATTYNWSVTGTGWSIISGQGTTSVSVTIGTGNGSVSVSASNGCGTSSVISTGTINPSSVVTPSAVTGPSLVCESNGGLIYSISSQSNALSYLWSVPVGWTINSGQGTTSISVTPGLLGQNGQVTVSAVNACNTSSPATLNVSVNNGIPAVPVLTGLNVVCPNSTGENYSVTNVVVGANYTWTLPLGATLVSGGTPTSSAVIDFGSSSGAIAVVASNVCGSSSQGILNVAVNAPAVQILATAGDMCVGGTAFYTIAGNIGEVLTYSINNSTIIDLPITVSPFTISIDNVSVNQTLSVITVSNPTFGCSLDYNDNYTVIVHPNIAANVSVTADQTTICQGNTAQFTAISNNGNSVPSYQWQVNGLNVGTNNSTFSWSNLNNGDQVSVVLSLTGGFCLVDDLDTSDVVVMIVNPTPAQPIVSVQNNCGNSLLTASGYTGSLTWNTSEVTPSITANSAGSYTVYQTVNGCESNSASATAAPKLIPSVQLGNDTTICTGSSVTLDAGNTGSTYSWTPSGSTSQTYAYSSSTAGSQIISVQVTTPNSCSNTDNVMITVESCAGVDEYLADFYLKVYPNPSNGIFYISHDDNVTINQIDVYSEDGKLIQTISSQINDMIDLQDVARGVYFVKILMEEREYLERVIVD